MNCWNEI